MPLTELIGADSTLKDTKTLMAMLNFDGYSVEPTQSSGCHIISSSGFRLNPDTGEPILGYVGVLEDDGLDHEIFAFFLRDDDVEAYQRFQANVVAPLAEKVTRLTEIHVGLPKGVEGAREVLGIDVYDGFEWNDAISYADTRTSIEYFLREDGLSMGNFSTGSMMVHNANWDTAPFDVLKGNLKGHEIAQLRKLGSLAGIAQAMYEANYIAPELDHRSEMLLIMQAMLDGKEMHGMKPDELMECTPAVTPRQMATRMLAHRGDTVARAQEAAVEAKKNLPHIYHPETAVMVDVDGPKHVNINMLAAEMVDHAPMTDQIIAALDVRAPRIMDKIRPESPLAFVFFNPDLHDFYDMTPTIGMDTENTNLSLVVAQAFLAQGYYPMLTGPEGFFKPQANFRELGPELYHPVMQVLDIAATKARTDEYQGIGVAVPMKYGRRFGNLNLPTPGMCLEHGVTSIDAYLEFARNDRSIEIVRTMAINIKEDDMQGLCTDASKRGAVYTSVPLLKWIKSFEGSGVDLNLKPYGDALYEAQVEEASGHTLEHIGAADTEMKLTYFRSEVTHDVGTKYTPTYYEINTGERCEDQEDGQARFFGNLFAERVGTSLDRVQVVVDHIRQHFSDRDNVLWFLDCHEKYQKADRTDVQVN